MAVNVFSMSHPTADKVMKINTMPPTDPSNTLSTNDLLLTILIRSSRVAIEAMQKTINHLSMVVADLLVGVNRV